MPFPELSIRWGKGHAADAHGRAQARPPRGCRRDGRAVVAVTAAGKNRPKTSERAARGGTALAARGLRLPLASSCRPLPAGCDAAAVAVQAQAVRRAMAASFFEHIAARAQQRPVWPRYRGTHCRRLCRSQGHRPRGPLRGSLCCTARLFLAALTKLRCMDRGRHFQSVSRACMPPGLLPSRAARGWAARGWSEEAPCAQLASARTAQSAWKMASVQICRFWQPGAATERLVAPAPRARRAPCGRAPSHAPVFPIPLTPGPAPLASPRRR